MTKQHEIDLLQMEMDQPHWLSKQEENRAAVVEEKMLDWMSERLNVGAVRRGVKYNEHHDRLGRFASGGSSEGVNHGVAVAESPKQKVTSKRVQEIATSVSKKMGCNPKRVVVEPLDEDVVLNGEVFKEAGHYDPGDDTVHIKQDGWSSESNVASVAAHEVHHHKWHSVLNAANTERNISGSVRNDEGKIVKRNPDGSLPDEIKQRCPTYSAMDELWRTTPLKDLTTEDGVSEYSRAYWKQFQDYAMTKWGKIPEDNDTLKFDPYFLMAVNETLSEMSAARINFPKSVLGGKNMRKVARTVRHCYKRLTEKDYPNSWLIKGIDVKSLPKQVIMYWNEKWEPVAKEEAVLVTIHGEDGSWKMLRKEETEKENTDGKT